MDQFDFLSILSQVPARNEFVTAEPAPQLNPVAALVNPPPPAPLDINAIMKVKKSASLPPSSMPQVLSKQDELAKAYFDAYGNSIAQQKESIKKMEEKYGGATPEMNPIVAALAAASDFMGGKQEMLPQILKRQQDMGQRAQDVAKYLQDDKNAATQREAELLKAQLGYEQNKQEILNQQELKRLALTNSLGGASDKAAFKMQQVENNLFNDWRKDKTTQASQEVATAYEKVKSASKDTSPASGLSLIFGYMKMLDPGSTVREGEFATAESARAVPDTVRNLYNKIVNGDRLTPQQRVDFSTQAEKVYKAQLEQQKRVDAIFKSRAKKLNLNEADVVLGETLFGDAYLPMQGAPAVSVPSIREYNGKKYKETAEGWVEVK